MKLFNTLLELDAKSLTSSLHNVELHQEELQFELKKQVANLRTLNTSKQKTAYQYLLQCAEKHMRHQTKISLLELLFQSLTADDCPIDETMACDILTKLFLLHANNAGNVSGIMDMGRALIDRPIAWVAFLRFLALREVPVTTIMASHLLHDCFLYYMGSLPFLLRLYQLMEHYDETADLVESAKQITSYERGFETYALNGELRTDIVLATVPKEAPVPDFVAHTDNLHVLYELFGVDFLLSSLNQWPYKRNDMVWLEFMKVLFNQEKTINNQLSTVLNYAHEGSAIKLSLANLLTDQTIQSLIQQRNGNILCLIPFRPNLVDMIQGQDLVQYLDKIRQRSGSGLLLITGLIYLFDILQRTHEAAATIVLEKLIDAILDEPYVLEDETVVRKIIRFAALNGCIIRKVCALEESLDRVIQHQVKYDISELDYITIEDVWRKVAQNISSLQEIMSFHSYCPVDKYQLHVKIARAYYQHKHIMPNLDVLAAAFKIESAFSDVGVTPYERLAIEVLAGVDDAVFRAHGIEILDEHAYQRDWHTSLYGDIDGYQRAVANGNLGYLQWLHQRGVPSCRSFDSLVIDAAHNQSWHIVHYLYKKCKLKKVTVNIILDAAVGQGDAHVISMLWSHGKKIPTTNQIEQAFLLAVAKGDFESIQAIAQYLPTPKDAILTKGFKKAVGLAHYDIAAAIATYPRQEKLLIAATEYALMDAAHRGKHMLVERLAPLCVQHIVDKAFLKSVHAGHVKVIESFLQCGVLRPHVLKNAFDKVKFKNKEVAACLSPWCEPPVSTAVTNNDNQQEAPLSPVKQPVVAKATLVRSRSYSGAIGSAMQRHGMFGLTRAASTSCFSQESSKYLSRKF